MKVLNQAVEHIAHVGSLFGAVRCRLFKAGKHSIDRNARCFEIAHQGNRILQAQAHLAEGRAVGVNAARQGIDANAGSGGNACDVVKQVSRLALVNVPCLHGHSHVLNGLRNVGIGHLGKLEELGRYIVKLVTGHLEMRVNIADGLAYRVEVSRRLRGNALDASADFLGGIADSASALDGDVLAFLKLPESPIRGGRDAAERRGCLGAYAADFPADGLELVGVVFDGLPKLVKLALARFRFVRSLLELLSVALQILLASHDGALQLLVLALFGLCELCAALLLGVKIGKSCLVGRKPVFRLVIRFIERAYFLL